jgi:hypothetical protein
LQILFVEVLVTLSLLSYLNCFAVGGACFQEPPRSLPFAEIRSEKSPQLGDFSFAFPPNSEILEKSLRSEKLLPLNWLLSIGKSFEATSVGKAFLEENIASDWKLVSVRIAPCADLFALVNAKNTEFCWPEVRQVWQPFSLTDQRKLYPDDRAIQLAHDFHSTLNLAESKALLAKARMFSGNLSDVERIRFRALQKEAQVQALESALSLRGSSASNTSVARIGERIEFDGGTDEFNFVTNSIKFLKTFAPPSAVRKVTAFSLPAGREPTLLDEWVFVSFQPSASNPANALEPTLTQVPQFVSSRRNGAQISPSAFSTKGTQNSEDEILEEFLQDNPLPLAKELHERTIFLGHDTPEIRDNIANPLKSSRFHVSCVSCHKLNEEKFNFHNFSYTENSELSVSPRVTAEANSELIIWNALARSSILNLKK